MIVRMTGNRVEEFVLGENLILIFSFSKILLLDLIIKFFYRDFTDKFENIEDAITACNELNATLNSVVLEEYDIEQDSTIFTKKDICQYYPRR